MNRLTALPNGSYVLTTDLEVCSWIAVRGGIEEPCEKPAVAWSMNPPDEEPCDPFPVCPAHTRVGCALTLDDPRRPR